MPALEALGARDAGGRDHAPHRRGAAASGRASWWRRAWPTSWPADNHGDDRTAGRRRTVSSVSRTARSRPICWRVRNPAAILGDEPLVAGAAARDPKNRIHATGCAICSEETMSAADGSRPGSTGLARAGRGHDGAGAAGRAAGARGMPRRFGAGGTLFFGGNGGSAADAQHLATEYVVRYAAQPPALRRDGAHHRHLAPHGRGQRPRVRADLRPAGRGALPAGRPAGPAQHQRASPNLLAAARGRAQARASAVVAFLGRGGGPLRGWWTRRSSSRRTRPARSRCSISRSST